MAVGGGTIVVIEDDEGMREAIASLLTAAGFETTVYASAETLLAADIPALTCCIVSDVRLPSMSGLELVPELRLRGAAVPVILITAHDSAAMRSEASRCGAAAYLPKPFAGTTLLDTIARVAR
ncbi:MAG: response regulator [Burkholderiales bacterium]|nr:response regulator [Burkholderiales bacterium]